MSSKAATREIREQHNLYQTTHPPKPNAMKERCLWAEPTPFIMTNPNDNKRIPIRNANHQAYRVLGTTAIWNKCVQLGYYMFDNCMQFHKVWKSTAKDSVTHCNKIIWQLYHFHRMNDIKIKTPLEMSATSTARPYLKEKDPDFLLTTDIEYEEKEFFAACIEQNRSINSDDTPEEPDKWTKVTPKKKTRKQSPPNVAHFETQSTTHYMQQHGNL